MLLLYFILPIATAGLIKHHVGKWYDRKVGQAIKSEASKYFHKYF